MKKTVALIIALCLVVLACVPSIPVRASSTENEFVFYSYQSVDGCLDNVDVFGRTNEEKNSIIKTIYNKNSSYYSNFYNIVSSLDSSVYGDDDLYLLYYRDSTLCYMGIDSSRAKGLVYINGYNANPSVDSGSVSICFMYHSAETSYTPTIKAYINSTWTDISITRYAGSGYYYYLNSSYPILYSNIKIVDYSDLSKAGHNPPSGSGKDYAWTYQDDLFDYSCNNVNLKYTDSSGNSVLPQTDPEVNTALAFDVFNSQVVYNQINKTFTSSNISWDLNPMGRTILETYPASEWDMKFTCQVTYNMSSYRPNNQTTPLQSYANGFTFTGTYAFEDYDSIMDGQIYGIDPIKGFETLSDAEIASAASPDCNLFFALLGAMKGDYASGNSHTSGKTGFSLLGGTIVNNWTQFATTVGGFGAAIMHLEGFTGQNGREWLEDHVSGDYIYMLDNFTMNVQAWFECGSIKSQSGYTDIDFVNHTTSSYAPRAYETEEGVTPTIPDPYTNTNDVPVEPGGLDANGVIVYVPVNVEVNVPSGGGDNTVTSGDNSIINNNNPTFNPVFNNNNENSVESLSDLIGEDAATANNGIGGFLDPFKNNAMVTLTGEYLGIIPDQLKTLLTAAVGILIILGIYRFIRRG